MKRSFIYLMVLAMLFFSACSHNGSISGEKIRPGSAKDPFANSKWTLVAGDSSTKIIEFYDGNKVVFGYEYGYTGLSMKGTYTVTKTDSGYVADCIVSSSGEKTKIIVEMDLDNKTEASMNLEPVYYHIYKM